MTKIELIEGYLNAEKPYDVCIHTTMGSYMEFIKVESGIMFEHNAKEVCERYADIAKKDRNENFKGVCVCKRGAVIYEVTF